MTLTPRKQHLKKIMALCLSAGLLTTAPAFASGEPVKTYSVSANNPEEDKPAKKSKVKSKSFSSLNNSSVKIYPDVIKRDMHVVAKDNGGKEIDFFVFDVDGVIMQHYKMKEKDHYKISGLARGTYVYRVFSGDLETAAGNFQIR